MANEDFAGPAQRWNRRWSRRAPLVEPASFVVGAARFLPASGAVIDVAGGTGRHALWLARKGYEVTLVDVSPVALGSAVESGAAQGLSLEVVLRDLEADGLPQGSWDVILIHHFLDRAVLAACPARLNPGGVLVFVQPTVRNAERHERPSARFLLAEGELATLVSEWDLEMLVLEEGWGAEGRHEARYVGRRAG